MLIRTSDVGPRAGPHLCGRVVRARCREKWSTRRGVTVGERRKPRCAGLSLVRRRGLEPPPGYPGPGPQPGASTNSAIGARATASIDRLRGSAGVAHARGDAVDGEEARPRQLLAVAVSRGPGAAQELDLE